ncbi:hypothetical protein Nepgr_022273 [Nepenthes gracilis]|uniref:Uncharacterized protein n=1 Tax=Nepenthes gracilis TaxID=150966 RepID=A0AAD3T1N0_NEPGR|nr:hypothetical protein Nepgr_022273 [Nepenthes gracilis]
MRTNCCHSLIAFILKFFNSLQLSVGVSIVIYSFYLLNHWQSGAPILPSPVPAPNSAMPLFTILESIEVSDQNDRLNLGVDNVSGLDKENGFRFDERSAPW